MARIILHEELEQKPEIIEHQLAHSVPDTLGLAYNWTRFIKERSYDAGLGELLGCAGSQWDVIPLARPHAAWSFTAA
ncbi:hypothetical protein [Bordetella petrii]|uniref:hypothetical protein n=1 Tax=Bordetella petrii TaxID=94624 RepID=UPI001A95AAE9